MKKGKTNLSWKRYPFYHFCGNVFKANMIALVYSLDYPLKFLSCDLADFFGQRGFIQKTLDTLKPSRKS